MKFKKILINLTVASSFIVTGVQAEVISVNGENFDEIVLQSKKPVVLTLCAPWAGHCKRMKPEFSKASEIYNDVVFAWIDVSEDREIGDKYIAVGYPTILLIKSGEETARHDGALGSPESFKEFIYQNK